MYLYDLTNSFESRCDIRVISFNSDDLSVNHSCVLVHRADHITVIIYILKHWDVIINIDKLNVNSPFCVDIVTKALWL